MAQKHTTTIEINGRRYDAITGQPVHDNTLVAIRPIDDVVRVGHIPASHITKAQPAKPKQMQPVLTTAVAKSHGSTRTPHHAKAHQPQHGKTLMRQAVHKPAPGLKRHTKAVTRTDILAKVPQIQVAPKWSFTHIDPQRLRRAERVAKSKLISKFAPLEYSQPAPKHATAGFASPQQTTVYAPPRSVQSHPQPRNRSMDIFQRALTHATAHEQPLVDPKKLGRQQRAAIKAKQRTGKQGHHRRTAMLAASAAAVVLLTGFIAYQNKANLTLRVASASAGFHASLPGYKPAGFALGTFNYSAGKVAISFHNNATNKSYNLTQKASNWDSQTLLDSYVASQGHAYQTLQSGGRTIYIYGDNNASWVNNGIWYQVNSNGNLSTSDVLHIASSI